MGLIIILSCFWAYLAYGAYSRGDMQTAGVYIVIGVALAVWRTRRLMRRNQGDGPSEPKI